MPSELAGHWTLDPAVTFLNHGSFGATPRPVLEAQSAWRERMEREPVAFFAGDLEEALDGARARLATFVGADPDDLAFVTNATTAINIVARSLNLAPGDEIVVLDHAYNAARNTLADAAEATGAVIIDARIPFPGTSESDPLDSILAAVTPRTRLVMVDHVTSPTSLLLPVAEIVAALAERGIDALVDGAHAPGMVELDVDRIGAAYYAANCHKWLCAPKGSAFLHVRRDRQDRVRPIVISHGANSPRTERSRFRLEHDWTGTLDPSPWLAVPAAIDFGAALVPGGWPALRARGHELAIAGRDLVLTAVGGPVPAPDAMVTAMVSVPIPHPVAGPPAVNAIDDELATALLAEGIRVAIVPWPREPAPGSWQRLVRISAAPYVGIDDLERLAHVLRGLAGHTS
ncbi:MAG TPA: aminotransferase class V-fold PLP-dependent enzyme [Candidatus Limnocylindria bacterium]